MAARIKQIAEQSRAATSSYDRTEYDKRRAALDSRVAVIKVGGAETDRNSASMTPWLPVKAALADGIVPGGGVNFD